MILVLITCVGGCSFITLMFVVGHYARDLHYVQPSDLLPECVAAGEVGYVADCLSV